MNKYIISLLLGILSITACSDEDNSNIVTPTARGVVTDNKGNEYKWVRIGDLDWTTSNAKNGASMYDAEYESYGAYYSIFSESQIEELTNSYSPIYGNLMQYEEALKSAPEGWRLPTDEDWKNLEKTLGMNSGSNDEGWRGQIADRMMQADGGAELGLQLGGGIIWTASYGMIMDFMHFQEYGYYWTSTLGESHTGYTVAYYRKIAYGQKKIERRTSDIARYFSVRWVRDAQ